MKIYIKNSDDFLKAIIKTSRDVNNVPDFVVSYRSNDIELRDISIENVALNSHRFTSINFIKCVFTNVIFTDCTFNSLVIDNCEFINCRFQRIRFIEIDILSSRFTYNALYDILLVDSTINKVIFRDCNEITTLKIHSCLINLEFNECNLFEFDFSNNKLLVDISGNKIITSTLTKGVFRDLTLNEFIFKNNNFESVIFANCILSNYSIDESNSSENKVNYIDFQTINKSEIFNANILKNLFGIHEPDVKNFVEGLTQDILFQTVFISYSFKDKSFASQLNGKLRVKGVSTFLWQEDAPGGQYLHKIMSENIQKHDRLLFIASKNSIKSEACQYELTKGREKYEKTWEIVLFPIHIDNYLFDIQKDDIPPKNRDSYWENIQELRRINSIDFSEFNTGKDLTNDEHLRFEKKVSDLIRALKKQPVLQ